MNLRVAQDRLVLDFNQVAKLPGLQYTQTEKRTPHCKLTLVKHLLTAGKVRTTQSARAGAVEMGFSLQELLDVVGDLTSADFYKSMTTHADHRVWQDVYRPETVRGSVYLKLTVVEDLLIASFKELES